jgi:ATP-binding cassette subfamily B protein
MAWRAAPGWVVAQVAVGCLRAALPVAVAWLTRALIDGLGAREPSAVPAAAGLVVVGAATAVTPHLSRFLDQRCEYRTTLRAQDILYRAVNRIPGLGRFEEPRFQDQLRYAQGTAGAASSRATSGLVQIGAGLLTTAGLLSSLAVTSPITAAFLGLSAVPVAVAEFALARRRAALLWDLGPVERRELFFAGLITSLSAVKEVRLFGIGDYLRGRVRVERRRINALRQVRDRKELTAQTGLAVLAAVTIGAGAFWIVSEALRGSASPGDVAMFVAAVTSAQAAVVAVSAGLARTYEDLVVFEHFQAVVEAGPDLPLEPAARTVPRLRRGIELRDVWFRYSADHPWILRGVDLHIPAGSSLALVGRNGAGKSTLVKLLCRFYDPTRGEILWDGIDLRRFSPDELRGRISAVFQDYMHYDLTARENIALGDLVCLEDQPAIERAARRSGVHDSIAELVHGYDTMLTRLFTNATQRGDEAVGVMLSGGQWQRLALARAFLRGPRDLLILDEPSSGLDPLSEARVQAEVRREAAGTTVVISHRLSMARGADLIAVLEDGRIAAVGDHDTLMSEYGLYRDMFTSQARGYGAVDPAGISS